TSDTLLGTVNDAAIAAGNFVSDSLGITLSATLAPGTYWIGVIADSNSQVSESNENNNSSTAIQITVRAGGQQPDLVANTVSVTGSFLLSGGGTTISYHIQNTGNASAGASVSKVYLSSDNTITTSDTLLASMNDASITAGTFASDSVGVALPAGLASG